mgnify:CR=1 FL=1
MSKRSKSIHNLSISDFYCTHCGNKGIPIIRPAGQERESGHLKKIFCFYWSKICQICTTTKKCFHYLMSFPFWMRFIK